MGQKKQLSSLKLSIIDQDWEMFCNVFILIMILVSWRGLKSSVALSLLLFNLNISLLNKTLLTHFLPPLAAGGIRFCQREKFSQNLSTHSLSSINRYSDIANTRNLSVRFPGRFFELSRLILLKWLWSDDQMYGW